jgi:hypothetical protein
MASRVQSLQNPLHRNAVNVFFLVLTRSQLRRAQCVIRMERVDTNFSRRRVRRLQSLVQTAKHSQLNTPQRTTATHGCE